MIWTSKNATQTNLSKKRTKAVVNILLSYIGTFILNESTDYCTINLDINLALSLCCFCEVVGREGEGVQH